MKFDSREGQGVLYGSQESSVNEVTGVVQYSCFEFGRSRV